jgi:hypothetical protein
VRLAYAVRRPRPLWRVRPPQVYLRVDDNHDSSSGIAYVCYGITRCLMQADGVACTTFLAENLARFEPMRATRRRSHRAENAPFQWRRSGPPGASPAEA